MAGPSKNLNRARLIDENFSAQMAAYQPTAEDAVALPDNLPPEVLLELFESQLLSRHLDLMARALRLENKVFYTIGSSGHEGNVLLGRLTRFTDPAFLHYRSGAMVLERSRQVAGIDPVYDAALSFCASADDPASGGRHKVWGSKPLWILPQTSTIASHLPKAFGTALAIDHGRRVGHSLPVPSDAIALCSLGDASLNHSTAQGTLNAAAWAAHQGLGVPLLIVCEDNGLGISVRTPKGWVESSIADRHGLDYVSADGLDLASAWTQVRGAVEQCRNRRRPTFLHLKTERLMGHAGTDFEVDYRSESELTEVESRDPLLTTARTVADAQLLTTGQIIERYEAARERCSEAAQRAQVRPRLDTLADVMAPLAPTHWAAVKSEATRVAAADARKIAFNERMPEADKSANLAINLNRGLAELLAKYPQALVFGEDVAQKGGVYTITRQLHKRFGGARVFNTLLDEQTILGLAQGYANMGMLPIPEIQYLAYFHNACDQIRGEASSLQYFSDARYANPMVVRIAGLGYQKGFGGHFHNDTSITALRDIPGLIVGCPSRGDDAAVMLRTLAAAGVTSGRVCVMIEPIALYMTRDLHAAGDEGWLFDYPSPDVFIGVGEPRIYHPFATDLLIVTYGNGVPMSLRVAKQLKQAHGLSVRVMDLRWLVPLNEKAIVEQAQACDGVLVVDEGRHSGALSEGVLAAIAEAGNPADEGQKAVARVCGADCFTPLGPASSLVLPDEKTVLDAALMLLQGQT
ncbi:MAG: thiamine pyrophosphate-dependent enzyme [Lysobacterales bacterium]